MKISFLDGVRKVKGVCGAIFRRERKPNTITIFAYPKFIFFWPVWLLGLLLWAPTHYGLISPTAAGWTYVMAFTVVMIALGFELSRDETIFAFVAILLLWVFGLWLRDAKHVLFLSTVMTKFFRLQPDYVPNFGLVISIIMMILAGVMFVKARLNDRWILSPNSIEHYQFGRKDDSFTRGAKTVSYIYPDSCELFLLGAGTIMIYTPDGVRLLREIRNVPFLKLRERHIDALQDAVAVQAVDELEIDSDHHGDHDGSDQGDLIHQGD